MIKTAFKEHVNDFFNMMYGGEIIFCVSNLVCKQKIIYFMHFAGNSDRQ